MTLGAIKPIARRAAGWGILARPSSFSLLSYPTPPPVSIACDPIAPHFSGKPHFSWNFSIYKSSGIYAGFKRNLSIRRYDAILLGNNKRVYYYVVCTNDTILYVAHCTPGTFRPTGVYVEYLTSPPPKGDGARGVYSDMGYFRAFCVTLFLVRVR